MGGRVLIIGMGDLGQRLAERLIKCPQVSEVLMAGRRALDGIALSGLLAACGEARVRFIELNAGNQRKVEQLLRRERPDIVVHCASLLSPWCLSESSSPVAAKLLEAGFAVQLPAQLPLIYTLMAAVREVNFCNPVVNCSYPDITNRILACIGLAPTIGIGNVGMILARVRACLREQRITDGEGAEMILPFACVLAHHAQVTSVMISRMPDDSTQRPWVYLGEEGRRADDLAYAGVPLKSNRSLNALSADSGIPIIQALLPAAQPLRTSAPGPLELEGGYPVLIKEGKIELDLPTGLSIQEAFDFQSRCARMDGVESISEDGTVSLTQEAQAVLGRINPLLCEPLAPHDAFKRFKCLLGVMNAGGIFP